MSSPAYDAILAAARAAVENPKPDTTQPHWDNDQNDPNLRKSLLEDPDGTRNTLS